MRPSERWEYAVGTRVLSLWRNKETAEWTTEFYRATVKLRPCDRAKEEERGYLLMFEEKAELVVPEKFVCPDDTQWNLGE
jgi:hypothetical protein